MNAMRIFQVVLVAGAVATAALALPGGAGRANDNGLTGSMARAETTAAARDEGTVVYVDAKPIVASQGLAGTARAATHADAGYVETRVLPITQGVLYYEAPTVYVNACVKRQRL